MRRSEPFECLQREEAAVDVERHTRRFEVRFSGANVVKQTRKSPGAEAESRRMFGEQLLCNDLSCS
jgi:hypothetical protein